MNAGACTKREEVSLISFCRLPPALEPFKAEAFQESLSLRVILNSEF
jgi:hypothetical protein